MSESLKQHWENVYEAKDSTKASWHQGVPAKSMALIRSTGVPVEAPIIDVGGGASTLVDILLNSQYSDISVMDISAAALAKAQERLGEAADPVTWIESDVTMFEPMRRYYLWHDRAVLHFLTNEPSVRKYLDVLRTALIPNGHFVLATFGPEGPVTCSGLDVQRYSIERLTDLLQADFELRTYELEDHSTPTGTVQQFLYSWWQAKE